jgi:hypothetical protein
VPAIGVIEAQGPDLVWRNIWQRTRSFSKTENECEYKGAPEAMGEC